MCNRKTHASRCASRALLLMTLVLLLWLRLPIALACGPNFPNRLLFSGKEVLQGAPVADFRRELDRIRPEPPQDLLAVPPADDDRRAQTRDADRADLQLALRERGDAPARIEAILSDHAALRAALAARGRASDHRRERGAAPSGDGRAGEHALVDLAVPADLPLEFAHYLRGSIAWHGGDAEQARAHWRAVLALPVEQRGHRSTWAAYMIGRSLLEEDAAASVPWFEQVRTLAQQGHRDSLGLAAASLGWQALANLRLGRHNQAIDLYLAQLATGDDTAYMSLRVTALRILNADADVQRAAAAHRPAQQVVTAILLARQPPRSDTATTDIAPEAFPAWLAIIEQVEDAQIHGAERLAWAAYHAGDMDRAERWLAVAPADEPIAQWLRAKLLMRAGQLDEAGAIMAVLSRRLADMERHGAVIPHEHPWDERFPMLEGGPTFRGDHRVHNERRPTSAHVLAELGVIAVAREAYVEALDALLRAGGYWDDAAYLAERVLTLDELIACVDANWPEVEGLGDIELNWQAAARAEVQDVMAYKVRHLLARRLTRAGRWREAGPYYPASLRPVLDRYVQSIRLGHDRSRSNAERAEAFWLAARIARHEGIQLLATEVGPDWAIHGGSFNFGAADHAARVRENHGSGFTDEERQRLAQSMPEIDKRWHYRHVAADHAWSALALMPNDTELTAMRFCVAGGWLKDQDPAAADRFYKALVRRCGGTELGRAADRRRWFPPVEEEAYQRAEAIGP